MGMYLFWHAHMWSEYFFLQEMDILGARIASWIKCQILYGRFCVHPGVCLDWSLCVRARNSTT